jgi:hypothetical protein
MPARCGIATLSGFIRVQHFPRLYDRAAATIRQPHRLIARFETMKFDAMTTPHFSKDRPVDYFVLVEPEPDGPMIGTYNNHPIAAAVKDAFGRRYLYVGVATRRRDGQLDVTTLSPGEWFSPRGLVYRMESRESGGLLDRLRKRSARSDGDHPSL